VTSDEKQMSAGAFHGPNAPLAVVKSVAWSKELDVSQSAISRPCVQDVISSASPASWSRVAQMQEVVVEEPVESSLAETRRQLYLEVFLDKASQHLYLLLLPLSSRQRIHCRNPWPECPKWDKVRQS